MNEETAKVNNIRTLIFWSLYPIGPTRYFFLRIVLEFQVNRTCVFKSMSVFSRYCPLSRLSGCSPYTPSYFFGLAEDIQLLYVSWGLGVGFFVCLWFVLFCLGCVEVFLITYNSTFFGRKRKKKKLLNGALCGRIVQYPLK